MDNAEFLKTMGINPTAVVQSPIKEKVVRTPAFQRTIDEKRAELELRKLEIEIAKLEKPDTRADYWDKMLELQEKNHARDIAYQKELMDLKLEIAKLQIGGESDDSMLYMLDMIKPILPQVLEKFNKKEEKPKLNQEQYLTKMRDGTITPEMGFEDFKMQFPEIAKNMTLEQFKVQFENVKKNGLPKIG